MYEEVLVGDFEVSMLRFLFGGFFGFVVGRFLEWFNSSKRVE